MADTTPQPLTPKRSKSPTWVGTVISAKDEQIAAIKELADDKVAFMVERLASEYEERESRSKALYAINKNSLASKDATIKRLWITNTIQMLIIAAVAGITVTGTIPFIGDIDITPKSEVVQVD